MRLAINMLRFTLATVVSAGTFLSMAPAAYAASGEEVIKARVAYMEDDIGGQWKTLAAFAKNGTGSLVDVEKSAKAMIDLTKKMSSHFPKDSGRGNYPDSATRALPAIWKDSEGFQKSIQKLADESGKLAQLAREGNKDAVVTMIGASGSYAKTKIGCAECHESFRGPRAKK